MDFYNNAKQIGCWQRLFPPTDKQEVITREVIDAKLLSVGWVEGYFEQIIGRDTRINSYNAQTRLKIAA